MSTLSNTISVTAGGIDVASIVSGLMTAERIPLTTMQTKQAAVNDKIAAIAEIKTALEKLRTQSSAIVTGGLAKLTSSVSNPSAVTVSLGATARTSSTSFTIDRLASAHGIRTAATVASSTAAITTSSTLALSANATPFGITGVHAGAGVTAGAYTVSVTQASAGATITGGALASSTVITGSNNTLDLEIDGVARTVTIATGTYSKSGLVTAVQAAIDSSGGGVKAGLDVNGQLTLTTTHEGSTSSLRVASGAALAALGLAVTFPASVGSDGIIKIGTNPPVTVTSAGGGEVVSVSTGTGTIDLTLGSGLRVGDAKVAVVSTGDHSLASVASAINGAGIGATASAVKVADGQWVLQVNAAKTGSAGSLALDQSAFGLAGGLVETSTGVDAKITVGSGPGAYSVTAAGNTFTDVLQGVTFTATALSATPVTVSVGQDATKTADAVDELVTQLNAVIKDVAAKTAYDATTSTTAILAGDPTVRGLTQQLRSAITSVIGGSVGLAADYGLSSQKDGSIKFDRAVFLTKLAADPAAAERLFGRNGSSTGGVTWAAASDGTQAGSYSVEVTTAATRGTTGDVLVGGSATGQQIGVRVGTTTVTYDAAVGATATDIVEGLNSALARAGLAVSAEESGGGVKLTSSTFGASGTFETNLDVLGAGTWSSNAGTDVAGTINGEAAVGIGNRLSLFNLGSSPARGLAVDIDEGLSGVLANVEYQPGVAARLSNLVTNLTGVFGGITTSTTGYESKVKVYTEQISKFEDRLVRLEANYRRQWSAVQTMLSSLENQQNWLTQQITSMTKSSDG